MLLCSCFGSKQLRKYFISFQIVHLKRFQFMNGRWVKSNKIVNFPMENFDPSEFVVKRSTTGNCDTTDENTFVRTVNVQTVVEKMLEDPEDNGCDVTIGTSSGQVRIWMMLS